MTSNTRRQHTPRGRAWLLALAAAALLTACGSSAAPGGSAGSSAAAPAKPSSAQAQHSKITVGAVSPPWSIQIVTLAPIERGFFKEFGFPEVDYKVLSPSTAVTALISGEVTFEDAYGVIETARIRDKGEQPVLLGGRVNEMTWHFFGAKDTKNVDDLKGKVVATSAPGGLADIITRASLKSAGMDPDKDVRLVPVGSTDDAQKALIAGRVQAAALISAQTATMRRLGYPELVDERKVYPHYMGNAMGAMAKTVDKDPDMVKDYVKAMIKAYRWVNDPANQPEMLKIMDAHKIAYPAEDVAGTMDVLKTAIPNDGSLDMQGVQFVVDEEKKAGTVSSGFDVNSMLRLEPLAQAQKELGITPKP